MNHVQDIRKKVELMGTDQKCVILDINTQDYGLRMGTTIILKNFV